jgi:uncharacterized protein
MNRIEKLMPLIKPYYSSGDPAHDWPHIGRVAAMAKKFALLEKANLPCVLAAVYCHDLVNLPKDHPDRKQASTLAAAEAQRHLEQVGFNSHEIKNIQQAVIEHSFSKGLKPSTLEGAIVQDADRLDALGAIGVLRCAAVNTQMKSTFYDSFDPLAEMRELDDRTFMLDHYFVKLFKLPDLMNTQSGKAEGLKRVAFMKNFVQELMGEIRGQN